MAPYRKPECQASLELGKVLVTDLDGDSQPEMLVMSYPELMVDGHAALETLQLKRDE